MLKIYISGEIVYTARNICTIDIRRCVGDAAAGLGLHILHMSEGPFSHDAGHIVFYGILLVSQCF